MTITEKGIAGEQMARSFMKNKGYSIFEIDWIAERAGQCLQVEVKHKAAFEAPPFRGMGLERWKVSRRLQFENRFGIRAYLLCFEPGDGVIYGEYLKTLEAKGWFDTKNGIRIYPISSFRVLGNFTKGGD